MTPEYMNLPVYQQKQRILDMLENNQVIVVQSPTGSGKTTQLPVILHEAGYSSTGMIAVTQPRRIAALSVSEFISKQLGTTYPGLVGYKMRFEDKTDITTKIKIMTDGILLQEMKLDPWMSKYSVVMVDEAHERSLNIDFVLGLLKRVCAYRSDFKVIVSSATMNAELFSAYFNNCPIVNIDTITYPVTVVYDPPTVPVSTTSESASEALLEKINHTVERILMNNDAGDTLIFLPGEKIIKDCITHLTHAPFGRRLHLIPLYGRLAKEEQERVFEKAPFTKKKIVISTNIAETSVTIAGITSVIDSGLAKLNYYSPKTFTSSLIETSVSKASCNQRKGRAGRTQSGTCYRLYSRKDFENRQMYTTEEIYRTDLSEVILRMAELGISDFEQFDFISPPNPESLRGAIETLNMLKAINSDHTLSPIGKLMVEFPLMPRISRIIVEAILNYPNVLEEVIIACSFLSAQSPFVLPPGEEAEARLAHHQFRAEKGDFVSYLSIYKRYLAAEKKDVFCKRSYLDQRVMAEIANIKIQLEQIVSDLGVPVLNGGTVDDYLTCIAVGMVQFVCVRERRESYRSLTAEHIQIHPGSSLFREEHQFIVAGEIVKTSRMFAMSVSPLNKKILQRIDVNLEKQLCSGNSDSRFTEKHKNAESSDKKSDRKAKIAKDSNANEANDNIVKICGETFEIERYKGKKQLILPWPKFKNIVSGINDNVPETYLKQLNDLKSCLVIPVKKAKYKLLAGEKFSQIVKIGQKLDLNPVETKSWPKKANVNYAENPEGLFDALKWVMRITPAKEKTKELGFITLYSDGRGTYWLKPSCGFSTALNESLSSLELLIDEAKDLSEEKHTKLNNLYRLLSDFYKE
ncbi:MAG: ATP-dependent RNA helicase [Treponemataceae bacterium]|nr:ATP-dependent RNA helicase [Treponemataceae bacterium]